MEELFPGDGKDDMRNGKCNYYGTGKWTSWLTVRRRI